jgi:glycosyltransferase involved in cell wall biosynthesis
MLVENVTNKLPTSKKAAMYYKTEAFHVDVSRYVHTNNWEILAACKILNEKGFSVDVIDRGNSSWNPGKKYDLFLGLGVGNTGRNFVHHAKASGAPHKILLAMGPQPDISNKRTIERYDMFNNRTGHHAPPMRTVNDVTGEKFVEIMDTADFVFNIGEKGTPSYNSFLSYDKPVINFYPSISPAVKFEDDWRKTRKREHFLCFAGNGFICKGVDLVLESFLADPSKHLHICGPTSEAPFFSYYNEKIRQAPNVTFHGFIQPGGQLFNELASLCSFVVFHSASEGCCTSVATAIRAGLVPIVNPWTGILIDNNGIMMQEEGDIIETISKTISSASKMNDSEYENLLRGALEKSNKFSQESFIESYSAAIDQVIGK